MRILNNDQLSMLIELFALKIPACDSFLFFVEMRNGSVYELCTLLKIACQKLFFLARTTRSADRRRVKKSKNERRRKKAREGESR